MMTMRNRSKLDAGVFSWHRGAIFLLAGATAFHESATLVVAQTPASLRENKESWLPWVIAAALAVLVCVTAFINPKRSHLT